MTATTPTGQLWIDLALFGLFFVYAVAVVVIDSARRIKRGRGH